MWKNILIYIELFIGMAIYGSTLPASKLVTSGFPVFTASLLRLLIAVIILLPFAVKYRQHFKNIKKGDYLTVFLIAFSGVFIFSIAMLYGMKLTSGTAGSVIMSTTPAITALGAFIFFSDSLDWRKITAIILGVAGIILINLSGSSNHHENNSIAGAQLIFIAVCAEASYTLFVKNLKQNINPLVLTILTGAIAAVLFIIPSLFEIGDTDFGKISFSSWLALIWWGAGGMGLASVLWFHGVSRVSGSIAAGFMGVMSVSALVLSYIILGEEFLWIHFAGFVIVFTGVILISISHAKEKH